MDGDLDEDEQRDAESLRASLCKDSLERLIDDIYETTPECRPVSPESGNFLTGLNATPEAADIVALFTNQHYQERSFHEEQRYRASQPKAPVKDFVSSRTASITSGTSSVSTASHQNVQSNSIFTDPSLAFQQCRQLIEQTGFLSWEKRSSIDLLGLCCHLVILCYA